MTTVAGVTPGDTHHADEITHSTPSNRATHALIAVEPALPVDDLDAEPEHVRLSAAYDTAQAIVTNLPLLTLRERLVLAAALLPEFDLPDDA